MIKEFLLKEDAVIEDEAIFESINLDLKEYFDIQFELETHERICKPNYDYYTTQKKILNTKFQDKKDLIYNKYNVIKSVKTYNGSFSMVEPVYISKEEKLTQIASKQAKLEKDYEEAQDALNKEIEEIKNNDCEKFIKVNGYLKFNVLT